MSGVKIKNLKLGNYLSSYFKTINNEQIVGSGNIDVSITDFFKNFQIIKSYSEHNTHIRLGISEKINFEQCKYIDSADKPDFFYGLISHTSDDIEWQKCTKSGFSTAFNNKPILIKLREILDDLQIMTAYGTQLYVKYAQYWKDESGNKHFSDWSSIVLPTNTEVGANAQGTVLTQDFNKLQQYAVPQDRIATTDDRGYYTAYCSNVMLFPTLTANTTIVLDDYSQNGDSKNKNYRSIIQTGSSNITLEFKYDAGNGPEPFDSPMEASLDENTKYLIEVKYGYVFKTKIN